MFLVHVKTDNIYKDIAEYVETRFDTSNYEINRPFPKGKSKKVIGLMKDELDEQIVKKKCWIKSKTYSYLKGNNDDDKKKQMGQKSVLSNKILNLEIVKNG